MSAPLPGLVVGITEIAMRAGVRKQAVVGWRHSKGIKATPLPEPFDRLRTGDLYWWPEVEAWLVTTGRKTDADWTLEQVNGQLSRVHVPSR